MECTVLKSKSITPAKALEKLDRFIQRNQANQMHALQQQAAAHDFQAAGGDDDAAAAMGSSFVQHKINHISPDIFYQLTLMRDAMRKEQQQGQKEEPEDDE
jgi:hypothetical protein